MSNFIRSICELARSRLVYLELGNTPWIAAKMCFSWLQIPVRNRAIGAINRPIAGSDVNSVPQNLQRGFVKSFAKCRVGMDDAGNIGRDCAHLNCSRERSR